MKVSIRFRRESRMHGIIHAFFQIPINDLLYKISGNNRLFFIRMFHIHFIFTHISLARTACHRAFPPTISFVTSYDIISYTIQFIKGEFFAKSSQNHLQILFHPVPMPVPSVSLQRKHAYWFFPSRPPA